MGHYSKPNAENPTWIRPAVAKIFEVKPVYTLSIYIVVVFRIDRNHDDNRPVQCK